ncbi:hypothetical protein KQX54_021735 [Cotesia glomerata]|uniref:Uncharacterized protein n=1 Tax=Cotesia glomerata TaxID=32391 RepID=A0AAV7IVZ9_COTGL|nr:hypothetical protein KQX54_021735 [Cotesia glomerata]
MTATSTAKLNCRVTTRHIGPENCPSSCSWPGKFMSGSAGCGIVFPLVRGRLSTAGDRFSVETLRNESCSVSLTLFRGTKSVLAGLTETGDRNEAIARYFVGVQLLRLNWMMGDNTAAHTTHITLETVLAHEHGEATRQETGDWRMSWGPRVLHATCCMLCAAKGG